MQRETLTNLMSRTDTASDVRFPGHLPKGLCVDLSETQGRQDDILNWPWLSRPGRPFFGRPRSASEGRVLYLAYEDTGADFQDKFLRCLLGHLPEEQLLEEHMDRIEIPVRHLGPG